jgi:NAD(P)-dependent dehydrogenase (short-subunit alcohol dehydrogenase family)
MHRLEGKVAIITGGASGLGESTVRLFAAEGASIIIADIQDEAGRKLADELGPKVLFQHTDVTSEADVEAVVDRAVREFGHLDIMFNNAGSILARGSITEIEADAFDKAIALLLKSVFLGMKHAGAVMAGQGHGSIISTSSIAGLLAGSGPHVYSTAKCAVIHLTKSVALELGEHGVRVNCLCPGGVATPLVLAAFGMTADAKAGVEAAMAETQVLKRAGRPEDVARAALWLCSDEADYVTGQALTVDGGEATGTPWSKQSLK